MPKKRKKEAGRLWQMVDGEPHLISDEVDSDWRGRWYFHVKRVPGYISVSGPPAPLRLDEIREEDMLSTSQVAYLAGCSRLTVLRHVARGTLTEHELQKTRRLKGAKHNTMYFRGKEVLEWIEETPLTRGRPPKTKEAEKSAKRKTVRRKRKAPKRASTTRRKR